MHLTALFIQKCLCCILSSWMAVIGGHLPLQTVPASYKHNGSVCTVTKDQCGKDFGQTPSDEDPTPLGVTVRTCRCSGVTPCWASQRQQEEQVKMRGEERQPKAKVRPGGRLSPAWWRVEGCFVSLSFEAASASRFLFIVELGHP